LLISRFCAFDVGALRGEVWSSRRLPFVDARTQATLWRMIVRSLVVPVAAVASFLLVACAASSGSDQPGGDSGATAGTTGTGGAAGDDGSSGAAGEAAAGGRAEGSSGTSSGSAGSSGKGGSAGASGQAAAGGKGGAGAGGTAGASGAGGEASACTLSKPYSSKDTFCNACAETHCCAEVNACLDDTRCNDDYVNCQLACALLPDSEDPAAIKACFADCGTQYPDGKQLYDAAIGCVDTQCVGICE
jgi:hypothetical protein